MHSFTNPQNNRIPAHLPALMRPCGIMRGLLQEGRLGEEHVVSSKWVHDSTTPDTPFLKPSPSGGPGYAYQWWIPSGKEGVYMAQGIYGQCIYVDPARHVVIVQTSAWPEPFPISYAIEQEALLRKTASEIVP